MGCDGGPATRRPSRLPTSEKCALLSPSAPEAAPTRTRRRWRPSIVTPWSVASGSSGRRARLTAGQTPSSSRASLTLSSCRSAPCSLFMMRASVRRWRMHSQPGSVGQRQSSSLGTQMVRPQSRLRLLFSLVSFFRHLPLLHAFCAMMAELPGPARTFTGVCQSISDHALRRAMTCGCRALAALSTKRSLLQTRTHRSWGAAMEAKRTKRRNAGCP